MIKLFVPSINFSVFLVSHSLEIYTGCPTTYRTRHFFNNSKTNKDIATSFEQDYVRCVRNEDECVCSVCLFRCNIFIGCRITKEMPGLVGSGTLCISIHCTQLCKKLTVSLKPNLRHLDRVNSAADLLTVSSA